MQDNHSDCSGVAQHACLKQDTLAAFVCLKTKVGPIDNHFHPCKRSDKQTQEQKSSKPA